MSNKWKLKTSVLDLVGPLLKQLNKELENADTDNMKDTLKEIVDRINQLKKYLCSKEQWERDLTGTIGLIQREIDMWISQPESDKIKKEEKKRHENEMRKRNDDLKDLVQKKDETEDYEMRKRNDELKDLVQKKDETEDYEGEGDGKAKGSAASDTGDQSEVDDNVSLKQLIECMKKLHPQLRDCFYSLSIFPLNEKLNKRLLVSWWIGLGFVPLHENKYRTTEQYAELLFDDLTDHGILIPDETSELHNQAVKWCTIKPTLHKQLQRACKYKGLKDDKRDEGILHFYSGDHASHNNRSLLNINQTYLDSGDITKVLDKNRDLQVLQFGWWRHRLEICKKNGGQETESKDHIEVDGIDFLKKVGGNVTYLSLRGISRIEELPQDIGKLEYLKILDLRACHNLEKLPDKPKPGKLRKAFKLKAREVQWFKNLNHLDMSECYLLDHMPKWMCELSNLEVLKGFVVGGVAGSKDQFCQIEDLSKLKKLRKLSIKIAKLSADSMDLKPMEKLSVLTITWRHDRNVKVDVGEALPKEPGKISFPENVEKLDIRCYPYRRTADWFKELKILKRLYIRGGKLEKLIDPDAAAAWTSTVEMLRLKSLKSLELPFADLRDKCPKLKWVQYYMCSGLEAFPDGPSHAQLFGVELEATYDEPKPPSWHDDKNKYDTRHGAYY